MCVCVFFNLIVGNRNLDSSSVYCFSEKNNTVKNEDNEMSLDNEHSLLGRNNQRKQVIDAESNTINLGK